jgi:hypothetical protein
MLVSGGSLHGAKTQKKIIIILTAVKWEGKFLVEIGRSTKLSS